MSYHLTGIISSIIFLLTIGGLWSQLRVVWERKLRSNSSGAGVGRSGVEGVTDVLSLNQFFSSFLAFFSFFLYGACLERFNHYLVWPRLAAALLTLVVMWEIARSRRDVVSTAGFVTCVALLLTLPLVLLMDPAAVRWCRGISQALIVVMTVMIGQGYTHQIVLIRQSGKTGAVSQRLHQFFLMKDISTVVFACAMGLRTGWPVLLLSTVSGLTKIVTLWMFRWVRLSPVAAKKREAKALAVNMAEWAP